MAGGRTASATGSIWLPVLVLMLISGTAAGIGAFTFAYARGTSYISNDPTACKNCHVMNSVFEGWTKSGHQHVAVCNDCHVPHDLIGKWLTKAENGMRHSFAFTFLDVPVAIRAREASRDIVQQNCIRCHSGLAASAVHGPSGKEESLHCLSCHKTIGHPHG